MSESIAPVIVIGMHRSGTSLLTRVLQRSGFFMGAGASRNEEAAFTNALNAWLFRQASATWDRPESVDLLLEDKQLRPWLLDYIGGLIGGPGSLRFLGLRRWLRYGGLENVREPWGWKDPRNTYTLPLWLELFPNARVLHIVRHGVDVAESLRVRREAAFRRNTQRYRRLRGLYVRAPWGPKRRGFGPQVRCRSLEGAFSLWEAYVERARTHVTALGDRALEVSYESLLTQPREELARTLAFCGLEAEPALIEEVAGRVDPARAHAYRQNAELARFARDVRRRLGRHGYEAAGDERIDSD